jgi:hypothetical protein
MVLCVVKWDIHLAINVTTELWGPSPAAPEPVRPGG